MKLDVWFASRPGAAALLVLRLALAAVFAGAAIPKLRAPDLFAGDVLNYQMLPPWGVNTMALVLPWVELVVAVCLALGLWSRASATLVAGMMLVFLVAFLSARARGLDIACGCFEVGASSESSSILWFVLRDLGLLAAALLLVRHEGGLGALDGLARRRSAPAAPTP